jgi:multidrug transporter EmrE-like cation transporter
MAFSPARVNHPTHWWEPNTCSVVRLAGPSRFAAIEVPIGTAYSVWVGIGAIGGAYCFNEVLSPLRLACVALLVIALAGLKLTSPA